MDCGHGTGNEAGVTGVLKANLISADSGIVWKGEMVARIPHFWTVTQLEKVRRSAEGLPCDHGAFGDVLTCNE